MIVFTAWFDTMKQASAVGQPSLPVRSASPLYLASCAVG